MGRYGAVPDIKQDSSTQSWAGMGTEWPKLAKGEARMVFIMPWMLELMGDVSGLRILDLGCGEGGYARELARRGAHVTAVDCSAGAIAYAVEAAKAEGVEVTHLVRNASDRGDLPDGAFDLVRCAMMLMDVEDLCGTLREVHRVLKPGGKVYASVLHPCFDGEHERGIGRQGQGANREVVVKNYFAPATWEAPLYQGSIPVLWRHRTLTEYVTAFVGSGLRILAVREPRPNARQQAQASAMAACQDRKPLYLYWVLEK